ncbi:MAG: L-serine ammonia-lyase, iron-sulfur-dependent, subunit alpha [Clostridia bacterium]|nr:L-serine ammonia-lyase, iron-sulfur-dependent, subunit alpha [Clostridia bacterium]
MSFGSVEALMRESANKGIPLWQAIVENDAQETGMEETAIFEKMRYMYLEMKDSDAKYDPTLQSVSGLVGGDGGRLKDYYEGKESLAGTFLTEVMSKAIKMSESNACMKKIVAAPTAGSCGVIPAVLLTYQEFRNRSEDDMVKALIVAAGIGQIIAENASMAGAEGGCQAEIGTAAAMSAAAVAYLETENNDCIANAAALAIKNMLGLTCDPVAGLVEVPCVKRNAAGAVNSVIAAQIACSGIISRIPVDQVIDSMRRIGRLIPACLRETGEAGLATTPVGLEIVKKINEI